MTFLAYCPTCEKAVTVMTMLRRAEIAATLDSDGEVIVMHPFEGSDHQRKLNRYEKDHLRKQIADGLV